MILAESGILFPKSLYNMQNDPLNDFNLVEKYPHIVKDICNKVFDWKNNFDK